VLFSKKSTHNTYFCCMQVYFDNAATTPLDPEVIQIMTETMQEHFGNPSSIHAHGRQAKTIVEKARKTVAGLLKAAPSEIFFTSGGTEADNMAIVPSIMDLGITHASTSPRQHHAVLLTLEEMAEGDRIQLPVVRVDAQGQLDLEHLQPLLPENSRTFV